MMEVRIFGKSLSIVERKSDKDFVKVKKNKIFVNKSKKTAEFLLRDFLTETLYHQISKIYEKIKKEGKIDLLGNLDFEVVENIDNKRQRIAKLKGNKILVKLNAVALPIEALKYVIVHEIAHIFTKRHTEKFWKVVKTIYPNFERGQKLFIEHGELLQ
jgi:hypothetical protein